MIYIQKGVETDIFIKVSDSYSNTNSGVYLFKIDGLSQQIYNTYTDLSQYPNVWSKFTIPSGDTVNLNEGQYNLTVYDLTATTKTLYKDVLTITTPDIDDNIYFTNSGESVTFFDADNQDELNTPSSPDGFNAVLLTSNPNIIQLSWYSADEANSYEIYRQINANDEMLLNTVQELTFRDFDIKDGNVVKYRVRSSNSRGVSDYTTIKTINT